MLSENQFWTLGTAESERAEEKGDSRENRESVSRPRRTHK